MSELTGKKIREAILDVAKEFEPQGPGQLQQGPILHEVRSRLGVPVDDLAIQQAILTKWGDLFLEGHVSWGYDFDNPNPPFLHLTARGRATLSSLSRDPANPDGYLAGLSQDVTLNPIADSYIREALLTYNASCYKSAAVMTGAAMESVALEMRDALVQRLQNHGRPVPGDMNTWMIKRVLDSMKSELDMHVQSMDRGLRESYFAYWPAFTQQIRVARNDAGHPASVDPVSPDTVQASLLIFPEVTKLAYALRDWIVASMA